MWVELSDGRTLGVPFAWFPRLLNATKKQREKVEIGAVGLHWEAIDEDISTKKQVQEIAVRAIEGASGAKTLAHVNDIAMEQAKHRGTQS